jgi:hypothetical protein
MPAQRRDGAGVDRLWREHGNWLGSVDLNPLIISADGVVAVDALLVARPESLEGS